VRALVGREFVTRLFVDDVGGHLVNPDEPPTWTLSTWEGAQVATGMAADPTAPGMYQVTHPALGPRLDEYAISWDFEVAGYARTVTEPVVLVGARLVEAWELRRLPNFDTVPDFIVAKLQDEIEEFARNALGYPAVPEPGRLSFYPTITGRSAGYSGFTLTGLPRGYSSGRLLLPGISRPLELYGVTAGGTAVVDADLAALRFSGGGLEWTDGRAWARGRYDVWLSHGLAAPPGDLRRAMLKLSAYVVKESNIPERATSVTTDNSTITFSFPTPDRPTGIADVDVVLQRYADQVAL
jgi:hypothetical protein